MQVLEQIQTMSQSIRDSVARVVVGQEKALEGLTLGLITGSHVLIEGLPGLAKTTLVNALATSLGLEFKRVQFTPDLMPADLVGVEVLEEQHGQRSFRFEEGPLFTQILLADEINRTPPKTQSALLQAMQEKFVSVGGRSHALPEPFVVFATQNPIENEGTYPLPEAQLDRFAMKVIMDYPTLEEEKRIAVLPGHWDPESLKGDLPSIDWKALRSGLESLAVPQTVIDAAVAIVRGSRPGTDHSDTMIQDNVRWGAGPRASQSLVQMSRARAGLAGRAACDLDDLRAVAPLVLRHRILPSFGAEARHITSDAIIGHLLQKVT